MQHPFNSIQSLHLSEAYVCIQGEGPLAGIPHILIRTNGCPMRCQFKGSFCDTPFTSWNLEKEKDKNWAEELCKLYENNPQITHTMISGGEPTANQNLLNSLTHEIWQRYSHKITIETAGYGFIPFVPNMVMSLSPKLHNSYPVVGSQTPWGTIVTEKDRLRHIKNSDQLSVVVSNLRVLGEQGSYYIKYVVGDMIDLVSLEDWVEKISTLYNFNIPPSKIYLMPSGIDDADLAKKRKQIANYCISKGYNYSDRLHIIIYGNERGV